MNQIPPIEPQATVEQSAPVIRVEEAEMALKRPLIDKSQNALLNKIGMYVGEKKRGEPRTVENVIYELSPLPSEKKDAATYRVTGVVFQISGKPSPKIEWLMKQTGAALAEDGSLAFRGETFARFEREMLLQQPDPSLSQCSGKNARFY